VHSSCELAVEKSLSVAGFISSKLKKMKRPKTSSQLAMAAISHVFTIRQVAQILGRDKDVLWKVSDQLEPEDGMLWGYDIDGSEILAFSDDGINALRDFIRDQIDRTG
jgi:hypothetical protein